VFSLLGGVNVSTEMIVVDKMTRFGFHVLGNHSITLSKYCDKLDYIGIVVLM
jgi:hypothetical protein